MRGLPSVSVAVCVGVGALAAVGVTVAGASAADMPVVFVPGLGGTKLVEKRGIKPDRVVWVAPYLINTTDVDGNKPIDKLRLGDDGRDREGVRIEPAGLVTRLRLSADLELRVSDPDIDDPKNREDAFQTQHLMHLDEFKVPVYGEFLEWAKATWPRRGGFTVVSYDWRKGAGPESDAALDRAITAALADWNGSGGPAATRVVLVAHSLGGLVARHYLAGEGNAPRVRALITAGTAWLGAPKPARALMYGYSFGLGARLQPLDKEKLRGIYIYVKEDQAFRMVPYYTLVSLIDLEASKDLARTLPCVFQLLPREEYFRAYGEALGRGPTSVFLGEPPGATRDSFVKRNGKLYGDADAVLARVLDGRSHGVRQTLIAGTLDPGIAAESAMDMQMADEDHDAMTWIGFELNTPEPAEPPKGLFRKALTKAGDLLQNGVLLVPDRGGLEAFWKAFGAANNRLTREVALAFFDINTPLRDFGNYNWRLIRDRTFEEFRERTGQTLPLHLDRYIAVSSDAKVEGYKTDWERRWGDGASPLLSTTLGRVAFLPVGHGPKEYTLPTSRLGDGVEVRVLPLLGRGKDGAILEHSRMLDEEGVQKAIRRAYEAARD
ncbi:MAG TPA: alpha/beta fold hydrolase [Isosphaeraceae bacterium]